MTYSIPPIVRVWPSASCFLNTRSASVLSNVCTAHIHHSPPISADALLNPHGVKIMAIDPLKVVPQSIEPPDLPAGHVLFRVRTTCSVFPEYFQGPVELRTGTRNIPTTMQVPDFLKRSEEHSELQSQSHLV